LANQGKNSGENNPAYGKKGTELLTIVVQFDKSYNYIETYKSIMESSRRTNISHSHIVSVCGGQRQTAGGCHWKYLYDQTRKDGTVIQGAISLGLITEEEALKQLNNDTE
jgi:hypothetical protein